MQTINLVLTILFTIEMVIKHVALGLLGYWSNGFNVLDGLIVIASLVDLGLEYSGSIPLNCDSKLQHLRTKELHHANLAISNISVAHLSMQAQLELAWSTQMRHVVSVWCGCCLQLYWYWLDVITYGMHYQ